MIPYAQNKTIDPRLLVSQGITNKPNPINSIRNRTATTGQLTTPVVSSPIQTPQQLMRPMSQEIPVVTPPKQEMPQQVRDNLIAGNTSQQSLQPQEQSQPKGRSINRADIDQLIADAPE
jgi:hypothetical protein